MPCTWRGVSPTGLMTNLPGAVQDNRATSSGVSCSYLVCATPRAGSHLLCEGLRQTGLAGRPEEFFTRLYLGPDASAYIRDQMATSRTSNGVFGARIGAFFFENLVRVLVMAPGASKASNELQSTSPSGIRGRILGETYRLLSLRPSRFGLGRVRFPTWVRLMRVRMWHRSQPSALTLGGPHTTAMHQVVAEHFPNLHYIYLRRGDRLRQAISFYRAEATREWVRRGEEASGNAIVPYDRQEIVKKLGELEGMERQWTAHFEACRVEPHRVTYEEIVADRERSVTSVLDYLGIDHPSPLALPASDVRRQSDSLTDDWVERYQRGD
jgi:LPS sulfotransferase NodH